jgi:hypothetical protein
MRVPWSCNACEPPHADVTPDGTTVAVVNDSGSAVAVQRLSGDFAEDIQTESDGGRFTLLGWDPDGQRLVLDCAEAGRNLTADEWRRYSATDPPADLACSR